MKKIFGTFILFIFGWKDDYKEEFKIKKGVLITAPHTSNWDFIFAMATFWKNKINVRFFIKDSYTKSMFGFVFKKLGAVGVDRSDNSGNMVDVAVNILNQEDIIFAVPAEGTRKFVEKWKTGFYYISKKSNTPLILGYLDYSSKTSGILSIQKLSDSFSDDMVKIEKAYSKINAKFPKNYNQSIH